jgi:hypothetical protein
MLRIWIRSDPEPFWSDLLLTWPCLISICLISIFKICSIVLTWLCLISIFKICYVVLTMCCLIYLRARLESVIVRPASQVKPDLEAKPARPQGWSSGKLPEKAKKPPQGGNRWFRGPRGWPRFRGGRGRGFSRGGFSGRAGRGGRGGL